MHDDFLTYTSRVLSDTQQAVINLVMFLPYFFSVSQLLKTLFAPWKNMTEITVEEGKKPSWTTRMVDQMASRMVGLLVRISILGAYLIIQVAFVLLLPFALGFIVLSLPLLYVFYTITPSPKEKREAAFNTFMKRHLLHEENKKEVVEWFEIYYQSHHKKPWWHMDRLKSQPPLGRDLSFGFTYTLDQYSNELTIQKPHHVTLIGRNKEIQTIQRILSKTGEANVLLSGEEGVGRHAIVEALAKSIYEGSSNPILAYKRILEIDIPKILSKGKDTVERTSILEKMLDEAESAKNIILYIKHLEQFVSPEYIDITNVLQKYAQRDTLQVIATTTPYNYQKYIFHNGAVVGLFEKVDVKEVTPNQALRIMLDVVPQLEEKYNVSIVYEAMERAVFLAHRHITEKPLPESAIELVSEACVYAKNHSPGKAVNAHMINTVVEHMTHVPVEIDDNLKQKLLNLENRLEERVLFQDHAMNALATALRKAFVNLEDRTKPLASFLFLGPTGVGKTETAKAVTEVFFESEEQMIRVDMSNYQSKSDVSKLLGSPNSNEPGILSQAVRNQKYGTLLLDEIEKAHPDILNIFLTILDEGYFTDGYGKNVDCSHLIVIATSNAGAKMIFQSFESGQTLDQLHDRLIDHLVDTQIFSPEFLNRFDGVITYRPLYKESIEAIARRMLKDIKTRAMEEHNITVEYTPSFIQNLVNTNYNPKFGARNMQRLIRQTVEDKISKAVLEGSKEKIELA